MDVRLILWAFLIHSKLLYIFLCHFSTCLMAVNTCTRIPGAMAAADLRPAASTMLPSVWTTIKVAFWALRPSPSWRVVLPLCDRQEHTHNIYTQRWWSLCYQFVNHVLLSMCVLQDVDHFGCGSRFLLSAGLTALLTSRAHETLRSLGIINKR